MIENRKNYRLDVDKIKTIKDVKNVLDNLHLIGYYDVDDPNDENYYLSEYFTIPQERQGLTFSTPRKSIEELQQELDEKFENLLVKTKRKFAVSKESAEYQYNQKFNRIIKDFEYAKEHGKFLEKSRFIISNTLSANSKFTSTFVIKQGNKHEGYYTIGNGYLRFYMPYKPNAITRWFMNKCLSIRWVDEK